MNNNSQKQGHLDCGRVDYFYEVIEINVNTSDYYLLSANSNFSTYGYLYKHYFDPYNSQQNLCYIESTNHNGDQFNGINYLQTDIKYTLIIRPSTYDKNAQGPFSIFVYGPDRISMKIIGKLLINLCFCLI